MKDRFMESVKRMIREKKKRVHRLCQKARYEAERFRCYEKQKS